MIVRETYAGGVALVAYLGPRIEPYLNKIGLHGFADVVIICFGSLLGLIVLRYLSRVFSNGEKELVKHVKPN
jgi:hypothetical protein